MSSPEPLTTLRHPIPETTPLAEARQLVTWLRQWGAPTDICDRLEAAIEGRVVELMAELAELSEIAGDDSDDDWDGDDWELPELVEGQRLPVRHATVVLRHPGGDLIPIDEELAGVVAGLWAHGVRTAWCCQEDKPGYAGIGLIGEDAVAKFRELLPAASRWEWREARDKVFVPAVFIPRDELAGVERLLRP
jgi:hypothetical protein